MTVHGARVWKRRWCSWSIPPRRRRETKRLSLIRLPQGVRAGCAGPAWCGPARGRGPTRGRSRAAAMLDETEDEYRRLLYVAMTRAADRLIIGGCTPGKLSKCACAVLSRQRPHRGFPRPAWHMEAKFPLLGRRGEPLFAARGRATPAEIPGMAPVRYLPLLHHAARVARHACLALPCSSRWLLPPSECLLRRRPISAHRMRVPRAPAHKGLQRSMLADTGSRNRRRMFHRPSP